MYIDLCLPALRSRARRLRLESLLVAHRHRACPIEITFWISQTLRGPAILVMVLTPSARRNTQPHSSVHCAQSASHVLTTCVRICVPTPTSVHSYAAFVARHLLASMTGNDTRVCIRVRRNSSAAVTSRTMVTGAAVGDLLVQMLLAVISGPKLAASVYVLCSRRKRKKRVAGTVSNNNNRWPMATACSTLYRRISVA